MHTQMLQTFGAEITMIVVFGMTYGCMAVVKHTKVEALPSGSNQKSISNRNRDRLLEARETDMLHLFAI